MTIDVACPTCAAQPGQSCVTQNLDEMTRTVMGGYHPARKDAANFIDALNDRAAHPGEEMAVSDELIEKTGLV